MGNFCLNLTGFELAVYAFPGQIEGIAVVRILLNANKNAPNFYSMSILLHQFSLPFSWFKYDNELTW